MRKKINLCVSVPENGVELLEILCRSAVSLASGLNEISLNFTYHTDDTKHAVIKAVSHILPLQGHKIEREKDNYYHKNSVTHSRCIQKLFETSDSDITIICDNDIALTSKNWDKKIVKYLLKTNFAFVGSAYSNQNCVVPRTMPIVGYKYQNIPNCIFCAFETNRIKNLTKKLCDFHEKYSGKEKYPVRLINNKDASLESNLQIGTYQVIDAGNLIPALVLNNKLKVRCFKCSTENYQILKSISANTQKFPSEEYLDGKKSLFAHFKKGSSYFDRTYSVQEFAKDIDDCLTQSLMSAN